MFDAPQVYRIIRVVVVGIVVMASPVQPTRASDGATNDGAAARPPFPMYLGLPVEPVRGETYVEGARMDVQLVEALQGDLVQHDFVVRNAGPRTISFTQVKACEGCILEGFSRQIGPGMTGRISIVIPTDPMGGQTLRGTVRAETDDPERPLIEIDVELPVQEFARVEPYRVWLVGTAGEPIEARCIVVPNADYPFEITGIKTRKGVWFDLSYRQTTHADRPAYEITLTNTRTRPGPYQDVLFIQTNHPARPEFKVRVEGRIEAQP